MPLLTSTHQFTDAYSLALDQHRWEDMAVRVAMAEGGSVRLTVAEVGTAHQEDTGAAMEVQLDVFHSTLVHSIGACFSNDTFGAPVCESSPMVAGLAQGGRRRWVCAQLMTSALHASAQMHNAS